MLRRMKSFLRYKELKKHFGTKPTSLRTLSKKGARAPSIISKVSVKESQGSMYSDYQNRLEGHTHKPLLLVWGFQCLLFSPLKFSAFISDESII